MSEILTAAGGTLWITRMGSDGNDETVASIGFRNTDGAVKTFNHARRVFAGVEQGPEALVAGDLILTLLDEYGDAADDDPLRIPASQADWFLDEWLKVPRSWRAKEDAKC